MEDLSPLDVDLARILLFSYRLREAMITEHRSLDRHAETLYNYHIGASASHIGLCALSRNQPSDSDGVGSRID